MSPRGAVRAMPSPVIQPAMHAVVRALQARICQLERRKNGARDVQVVTSGFAPLDRILPAGGLRRGTLVEWLAAGPGSGAGLLALVAAREACWQQGPLVIVDRRRQFSPLPLFALGMTAAEIVIVHPANHGDEHWAIDQALRWPAVGAVVAWPERIDGGTFRRLQLAAETSGAIGCFVRPGRARCDPTWADVRLGVRPLPAIEPASWRIQVQLLRWRSGDRQGSRVELMLNERTGHETHPLPVASELADPAARQNAIRA